MATYILILMLTTTAGGAAIEKIEFATEDACLAVFARMADMSDTYKKVGWSVDAHCAWSGE